MNLNNGTGPGLGGGFTGGTVPNPIIPGNGNAGGLDEAIQVIYTAPAHFSGIDTFTYTVNDGLHVSLPYTIKVAVGVPVANVDNYNINEDHIIHIPITGSLNGVSGLLTSDFTPLSSKLSDLDFTGLSGSVSITFSEPLSKTFTLDNIHSLILVNGRYDAISLVNGLDKITPIPIHDHPILINYHMTANTFDTVASSGISSFADLFNYSIRDSQGFSSQSVVHIVVNDLPPVIHESAQGLLAATVASDSTGVSIDPSLLSIASDPDSSGSISGNLSVVNIMPAFNPSGAPHGNIINGIYTPAGFDFLRAGQMAVDNFTYQVENNHGLFSNTGTFSVDVTGVYRPPVANPDSFSIPLGQTLTIPISSILNNNPPDLQDTVSLTYLDLQSLQGSGSVTFMNGGVTTVLNNVLTISSGIIHTSNGDFNLSDEGTPTTISYQPPSTSVFNADITSGLNVSSINSITDSFTYGVSDTQMPTTVHAAPVNITVFGPPSDVTLSTDEDQTLTFPFSSLLTNDPGDPNSPYVSFIDFTQSAFHGNATLTFSDNEQFSNVQTLVYSPGLQNYAVEVNNTFTNINSSTATPVSITYVMPASTFDTLTPTATSTVVTFPYVITDQNNYVANPNVDITVNDLPPELNNGNPSDTFAPSSVFSTSLGSTFSDASLLALASDPDTGIETNSLQIVNIIPGINASGVPHGTLTLQGSTFTYTPQGFDFLQPGQTAVDNFTYQVEDAHGLLSNTGTVSIDVVGNLYLPALAVPYSYTVSTAGIGIGAMGPGAQQDPEALLKGISNPQGYTLTIMDLDFSSTIGGTVDVIMDGTAGTEHFSNVKSVALVGGNYVVTPDSGASTTVTTGEYPFVVEYLPYYYGNPNPVPGQSFISTDHFNYSVSDGTTTSTATVTLHSILANNDTLTMNQYDGGLVIPVMFTGSQYSGGSFVPSDSILSNDFFADNNVMVSINQAAFIANSPGLINGFNGAASFSSTNDNIEYNSSPTNGSLFQNGLEYTLTDNGANSNLAIVTINVNSVSAHLLSSADSNTVGTYTLFSGLDSTNNFVDMINSGSANTLAINSNSSANPGTPVDVYAYHSNDIIGNNLSIGNNLYSVETGADRISGGTGDVTIKPGYGAENIFGGIGADTYLYDTPWTNYATSNGGSATTINDFESGIDKIVFSLTNANPSGGNGFFNASSLDAGFVKFTTTQGAVSETESGFTEDVTNHDLYYHQVSVTGGVTVDTMTKLVHFSNDVILTAADIHIS